MKRLTLILTILYMVVLKSIHAQLPLGEWQAHMAYANATESAFFNGKVYAISEGSLFSYNPEDGDVLTYDIVNHLSDISISRIVSIPSEKKLLIVYDNGNIDLMNNEDEIYNITDLKNANLPDCTVNGINVIGRKAYLSTNFGIAIVDVHKREIEVTYKFDKKIHSTAVSEKYIFAAIPNDGLYRGVLTSNLLDMDNWTRLSTNTIDKLVFFNNILYATIPGQGIVTVNLENGTIDPILKGTFTHFSNVNNELAAVATNKKLYLLKKPTEYRTVDTGIDISHISYGNSTYWVSTTSQNLSGYKIESNALKQTVSPISINAPKYNLFYRMFMQNGKLYSCGGGIFLAPYYNPGAIQVMDENGEWCTFDNVNPATQGGGKFMDVTSIAVDPQDDNHLFASTAGWGGNSAIGGVYEFQNGEYVERYTPQNSTVQAVKGSPNVLFPDGLKYDADGNLWILCGAAEKGISIYTKEKKWVSISHKDLNEKYTLRGTLFDQRGWMWCVSPHYNDGGIYILDYNGTLETTSDDRTAYINTFYNQDGDKKEVSQIYCAIEDREGAIWIGTDDGPWIINNPAQILNEKSGSMTITHTKIPRNDGTNLADYLLTGATVISMAVDGANRKWIGTEKNGVFLLSADGTEEIHHFTTKNSPLPSNEVQSIYINEKTGLVYIGTNKGLVSYQSDATQAQEAFSESLVRAYPNPVRPDYQGYISITGLMANSQVKITDSYGNLIHEGISTGGMFTWNGRNSKGERAASGVYHVLATDEKGEEGIATKIVIIK